MDVVDRSFELALAPWLAVVVLIVAALAVGAVWLPSLRELPMSRRIALIGLRVAAMLLVVTMLLNPRWVVRHMQPGKDFVLVLYDDSRSMRIAGGDGISRGQGMLAALDAQREEFTAKLRAERQLAQFRFGESLSRLNAMDELSFDQVESDPRGAIRNAIRDLSGAAVSAVVVFSDGVEQFGGNGSNTDVPNVPVFTVGVDTESPWRDLELKTVSLQHTPFDQSPVSVTAHIGAEGLSGKTAIVEVLEGERVAATRTIQIVDDSMESRIRLDFRPETRDYTVCEVRTFIAPERDPETGRVIPISANADRIQENNRYGFAVDNRERDYRILYLCGRPNWQNKYVRRALEEDPELRLSSLVRIRGPETKFEFRGARTSMNNPLFEGFDGNEAYAPRWDEAVFLRIGLDETELTDGYPLTPESLFEYDLVIWGDIEADYFSTRQMEITRDFVDRRGGSFLMLGGRHSFDGGEYNGTIVEQMLPVMLSASSGDPGGLEELFAAKPTVEGYLSGIWKLADDPDVNARAWDEMPPLFGVNRFPMLRAGATETARVEETAGGGLDGQALFAYHRYGQGRTAVMATAETWQWQMQREVDDQTHERFWRQLVRSLVMDVPGQVVMQSDGEGQVVGRPAAVQFLIRDKLFEKRESLNPSIELTAPGESPMQLPTDESIREPGVYTTEFTPETTGLHRLSVTAVDDRGEAVGALDQAVFVQPDLREFRNAQYNMSNLKSLSQQTGGRFFTLDQLAELVRSLPKPDAEEERIEVKPLWNFPLFFAMLAALLSIEWYLRRKAGQP